MKIAGIILLIILCLLVSALLFCLFSKIRLVLLFTKPKGKKPSASMHLEFLGGRIKKEIPFSVKKEKHSQASTGDAPTDDLTFKQKIKKYYELFIRVKNTWSKSKRSVRKRILAEDITLSMEFGTDDAAHTGIMTGVLWGAVYNVIAFLANFIRVTEPEIKINPNYNEEDMLEFDGRCILKLSLANIISVFLILYINYYFEKRKQTKKEKAAVKNVNTN